MAYRVLVSYRPIKKRAIGGEGKGEEEEGNSPWRPLRLLLPELVEAV